MTLQLVHKGRLSLMDALAKWTVNPAGIVGLPGGSLAQGAPGDVTLVDLDARWTVDRAAFLSKGKNTPFAGRQVTGRAVATFVGGEPVHWALPGPAPTP